MGDDDFDALHEAAMSMTPKEIVSTALVFCDAIADITKQAADMPGIDSFEEAYTFISSCLAKSSLSEDTMRRFITVLILERAGVVSRD